MESGKLLYSKVYQSKRSEQQREGGKQDDMVVLHNDL